MNAIKNTLSAAIALHLLTALSGCSSDSASHSSNSEQITRGTLGDSSGVSVNGTNYQIGSTLFTNDGVPVTLSEFSPGMQVTVVNDGTNAMTVDYEEDVRGPIHTINIEGNLTVLGQNITVTPQTVYELPDGHTLVSGDVIEVSGLRSADGSIVATWIGLEDADNDSYEVRGVVSDIDTIARTFTLGGLTIDYSTATLEGFTTGSPANGDEVEVENSALDYEPGSMLLIANEVELDSADNESQGDDDDDDDDDHEQEGDHQDDDDDDHEQEGDHQDDDDDQEGQSGPNDEFDGGGDYEIEALITAIDGTGGFTLGNVQVRVSNSTVYRNGDASGIVLNALVEAEGILAADGVLDATTIEFPD